MKSYAMTISIYDWTFEVDTTATQLHTTQNSSDHCTCAYCRNYYEALDSCCPQLRTFLAQFGINADGPSELMPFTPTLMLACYRVKGRIVNWGREVLSVHGIPILPEAADEESFFLWAGEMELPWLQREDMDEVVSPANLPEFLERMQEVWLRRHGDILTLS